MDLAKRKGQEGRTSGGQGFQAKKLECFDTMLKMNEIEKLLCVIPFILKYIYIYIYIYTYKEYES